MQALKELILKNLENNGFPAKKVSLPTEKMYEVADSRGVSLNTVLDELEAEQGIIADIGDDKIIFSQQSEDSSDPFSGMNQEQMMAKAQEMMSHMDPAELARMQQMFTSMSDQEKANLMQKGKDMGII